MVLTDVAAGHEFNVVPVDIQAFSQVFFDSELHFLNTNLSIYYVIKACISFVMPSGMKASEQARHKLRFTTLYFLPVHLVQHQEWVSMLTYLIKGIK